MRRTTSTSEGQQVDVHLGQPRLLAGRPLEEARAAMVLVHGRGGSATDILMLARELHDDDFAYVAPRAAGSTWYPLSFLASRRANEPNLGSGLGALARTVSTLEDAGVPAEHVFLLGFSQGACLVLDFVARHPQRYAGVAALTGGLIGAPEDLGPYEGSLNGTPVFLGAGDPDPHVPWPRVEESARLLEDLGAEVTLRRYPGIPHTIVPDELEQVRSMMGSLGEG